MLGILLVFTCGIAGRPDPAFTYTCTHTGDTSIGIRLLSSDPSAGPVTGFSYSPTNYPKSGSVLGSVGADVFFGNTLPVHCEVYGSVIITVN